MGTGIWICQEVSSFREEGISRLFFYTEKQGQRGCRPFAPAPQIPAKRTLPLNMFETYVYDAVGNLANKTDFNGKNTMFLAKTHSVEPC